jgi:hypothetical protein
MVYNFNVVNGSHGGSTDGQQSGLFWGGGTFNQKQKAEKQHEVQQDFFELNHRSYHFNHCSKIFGIYNTRIPIRPDSERKKKAEIRGLLSNHFLGIIFTFKKQHKGDKTCR